MIANHNASREKEDTKDAVLNYKLIANHNAIILTFGIKVAVLNYKLIANYNVVLLPLKPVPAALNYKFISNSMCCLFLGQVMATIKSADKGGKIVKARIHKTSC